MNVLKKLKYSHILVSHFILKVEDTVFFMSYLIVICDAFEIICFLIKCEVTMITLFYLPFEVSI